MKKVFIITIIMIMISFFVSLFQIDEKENFFGYIGNNNVRVKRNKKNVVEYVPLEEYVLGVVAGEMPIKFHEEALKAQAIAARTYVLKKMEQNKMEEYDVIDTISNQVYLDNDELKKKWDEQYDENYTKLKNVVNETRGLYITYNHQIITAFFFSTSVGKTENSEDVFSTALPYLRSVDSSWDKKVSPVFQQQNKIESKKFYERLNINYSNKLNYTILETTSTGRIKKIKINDNEFTGKTIAELFNLRSSYFTLKQDDEYISFETRGYGHGVGLSQYGAYGMAIDGYNYEEIIKHYYQGVDIEKL